MEVIYSDPSTAAASIDIISSTKKMTTMVSNRSRTPLLSLNGNTRRFRSNNEAIKKRSTFLENSLKERTNLRQNFSSSSLYEEGIDSRGEKDLEELNKENVSRIFREENEVSHVESYETTIQRANPIYESDEVCTEEKQSCAPESKINIYDENKVNAANIMLRQRPFKEKEDSKEPHEKKVFLEPPDDEFMSEEIEMMLTLKLANPIDESDSESDGSEESSFE